MEDPRYGTVPTQKLPNLEVGKGTKARVLAGSLFGAKGPFETKQSVLMVDFELDPGSSLSLDVPADMDTAILYVYEGEVSNINHEHTKPIKAGSVALLDADSQDKRGISIQTSGELVEGGKVMLFAGKKLREPIAWHGSIVLNTEDQLRETFQELRSGAFPWVRVDWDYKRIATKPK
jgi:redox-sensitive bicupin YhaK (pirin superfamily)